jgi:hypothetical protein
LKNLGGEKIIGKMITSKMDLFELGRDRITKKAVSYLADHLCLSWKKIVSLLPVTVRTLQRYSSELHFNSAVSEQAIHVAEVLTKGTACQKSA